MSMSPVYDFGLADTINQFVEKAKAKKLRIGGSLLRLVRRVPPQSTPYLDEIEHLWQ